MSLWNKKWLIIILKDFIRQPVIKQSPTFFFSHWLLHKCFFSFVIKAFSNFEKLIRFHWQAFIVYKNEENLAILIEIFYIKLIVSNVILAFLDHLKPKIFLVSQPWWPTLSATSFQNLWIPPLICWLIWEIFHHVMLEIHIHTILIILLAFLCLKSTMKTPEWCVKFFQS